MSKSRPIIFSAPMIRALLAGQKTQTRRIVKPQPTTSFWEPYSCPDGRWNWVMKNTGMGSGDPFRCRFGQPGDLLWVREAFRELEYPTINTKADYRFDAEWRGDVDKYKWRPSIHMPRWASRLTLRLTDVRIERLQEISEADAQAEGAPLELRLLDSVRLGATASHTGGFERLWESIHGPDSWDANPYVWALTFDVIHKNVDEVRE